jgi:putative membrane protein
VVLGSALLTAWDLFLDPQMTGEGYWRWERPGRYRGIPGSNYLGWFASGLGVIALLDRLLPAEAAERPEPSLVGAYGWMAVMSTLGFAAFFGDPLVAAAGGAAMVPAAVVAARRTWRWPT